LPWKNETNSRRKFVKNAAAGLSFLPLSSLLHASPRKNAATRKRLYALAVTPMTPKADAAARWQKLVMPA